MEKRFGAAVFAAVLLHAALIALTALRRHPEAPRVLATNVVASAAEVEIFMLAEERTSSIDEPSERKVQQEARVAQRRTLAQRAAAPDAEAELDAAGAPDPDAALAELGGVEPE